MNVCGFYGMNKDETRAGMGAAQSTIDPRHVNIYRKLLGIQNPQTRLQMIDTLLQDPSVIHSAKLGGVYGGILQVAAAIRHGGTAPPLPGELATPASSSSTLPPQQAARAPVQQQTASVPRQLQQHPTSFQQAPTTGYAGSNTLVQHRSNQIAAGTASRQDYYQEVAKPKRSEKALNFFSACLRVLNIQEEVALTEAMLKSAYKKAAMRTHPDKGGSKDAFDTVTRAYTYLTDIIKLVQGRQTKGEGAALAGVESIQEERGSASKDWQLPAKPVKLDPKNLDLNKFNQLFEQTRIPDPDEDGYGDWLKDEMDANGKKKGLKKFSEDFNREVFNRMFEEEAGANSTSTTLSRFQHPQELILNSGMGVELGRGRPADYTAAPDSKQQFTDLRAAYTLENTIQDKVSGIRVENRDFNSYKAQREKAPANYNEEEMASLNAYEEQKKRAEDQRRVRAAQEQLGARDYFERMKQMVIRDR
jgi:curved DNA-binding protein CbpA